MEYRVLILLLVASINAAPFPEQYLEFTDYCKYFGYPVETHNIITEDGYILTFFRINKGSNGKPVFLQHGVIDSSDTFIVNYPQNAPAFVLADAGYDVWVGNSRGNKYSLLHINSTLTKQQYWDFTWSDMASKDLPAAFEYITQLTGYEKIHYVGHSQGTLIMFASLAEENDVIKRRLDKFIALAPVVAVRYQESNVLNLLAGAGKFTNTLTSLGVYQVFQFADPTAHLSSTVCTLVPVVCSSVLKLFSDMKPELDHVERMPVVMGHYPAGASIWDAAHFAQMKGYDSFALKYYDYGEKGNMKKYNQPTPLEYDLSKIKGDIYLFYGRYDELADTKDVEELISFLKPNNPNLWSNIYDAGHATFAWGQNEQILKDMLYILGGLSNEVQE